MLVFGQVRDLPHSSSWSQHKPVLSSSVQNISEKAFYSVEPKVSMNAIPSMIYPVWNGSGMSRPGLLGSAGNLTTSQQIESTLSLQAPQNLAIIDRSPQWQVLPTIARGLAASQQTHEPWSLHHPALTPVAARAAHTAAAESAYPFPSSPQRNPDALLLHLHPASSI